MKRLAGSWMAAALLAAAGVTGTGCKSTTMGAAPTTFGVNITVDAKALSSAQLAMVTVGSLLVTGVEPRVKSIPVAPQITSGKLTFQYVPNVMTGTLTFGFEALDDARNLIGSGTSPQVTLDATGAVAATITLSAAATATTKGLGSACTAGSTCNSGFCTDGVCCQEACKDTCASCALTKSTGLCVGYPAGTDPENECAGASMTTGTGGAGGKGGTGGAGGVGGAKADSGAPMDASASDAEVINSPDGGIMAKPSLCGGSCNGMKACASFAPTGTSCGTPFCNTRKDVASPVCDGKGTCAIGLSDCTGGYTCDQAAKPTASCRTTCSANVECLDGYYCNGNTNMCAPTKTDGLTCATDAECNSNHCATGVCCNTACNMPGTTCNNSGAAGKCQCQNVMCNTGVACQIFYADSDADGYGDRNGTIAAGTAKAGCADTAAPTGFVADNTDCDDKDANVHPGQTAYFSTVSKGTGTFDYNCDGTIQKGSPEYPGASCTFCPSCSTCGPGATTCASQGATASLACVVENGICLQTLDTQQTPLMSLPAAAVGGGPIIIKIGCCGCNDTSGFTATVACGTSAQYFTCGTCGAASGTVGSSGGTATTSVSKVQTCH